MDNPLVLYETREQIAYITLNRPEKLNALHSVMIAEINRTWHHFEHDGDVRVGIVTGAGNAFCTGIDVDKSLTQPGRPDIVLALPGIGATVTKPLIAAINGYCLGGGMDIAMRCDIRIASENAQFGYPEVKIGVAGQGVSDLVDYVPLGIAMEVLLTGELFNADKAYKIFFVNKVTSSGDLLDEATNVAQILRNNAPLALKSLKLLAYKRAWGPLAQTRVDYYSLIKPQFESEDFKEGIKAFKEKRKPQFKNR